MLHDRDDGKTNSHIKSLQIRSELVWREFFFIGDVKIEFSGQWIWIFLDMIDLLWRAAQPQPRCTYSKIKNALC
jgi:hypothetical protein